MKKNLDLVPQGNEPYRLLILPSYLNAMFLIGNAIAAIGMLLISDPSILILIAAAHLLTLLLLIITTNL